jgi:small-conductance mechanosensitive channel
MYQALREHASIKVEPAPKVYFEDFGDSSLVFDAFFWSDVHGERELRMIRSDLRFRIDALFAEHSITIAFPQRDVHLDSLSPVQIELVRSESATNKKN